MALGNGMLMKVFAARRMGEGIDYKRCQTLRVAYRDEIQVRILVRAQGLEL